MMQPGLPASRFGRALGVQWKEISWISVGHPFFDMFMNIGVWIPAFTILELRNPMPEQ